MGKSGRFDYAYNARFSVDAGLQIIETQHTSQNANDKQEVEPALQALKESTGRLPEKLSADNGYWSGDSLQVLEQSGTDTYIATNKAEKTHKIPLDNSDRKEANNTLTCPEGQILTMKRESQDGSRVYHGSSEV